MKKIVIIIAIVASGIYLSSCFSPIHSIRGMGELITDTIELPTIHGIEIEDVINVVLTKSETQEIIIETQENILDLVELNVSNGICHVRFREHYNVQPTLPATIYISLPTITSLKIDGTGDINATNDFDTLANVNFEINGTGNIQFSWDEANDVEIDIDGTGDLDLSGNCDDLNTEIDGTGDLRLWTTTHTSHFKLDGTGDCFIDGFSDNNYIDINGSGDFYGFDYETTNCSVNIDGSGNAEVSVTNNLSVDIDGSGDVIYRGFPQISYSGNGSGDLVNGN
jgi:hypothetical protein